MAPSEESQFKLRYSISISSYVPTSKASLHKMESRWTWQRSCYIRIRFYTTTFNIAFWKIRLLWFFHRLRSSWGSIFVRIQQLRLLVHILNSDILSPKASDTDWRFEIKTVQLWVRGCTLKCERGSFVHHEFAFNNATSECRLLYFSSCTHEPVFTVFGWFLTDELDVNVTSYLLGGVRSPLDGSNKLKVHTNCQDSLSCPEPGHMLKIQLPLLRPCTVQPCWLLSTVSTKFGISRCSQTQGMYQDFHAATECEESGSLTSSTTKHNIINLT